MGRCVLMQFVERCCGGSETAKIVVNSTKTIEKFRNLNFFCYFWSCPICSYHKKRRSKSFIYIFHERLSQRRRNLRSSLRDVTRWISWRIVAHTILTSKLDPDGERTENFVRLWGLKRPLGFSSVIVKHSSVQYINVYKKVYVTKVLGH